MKGLDPITRVALSEMISTEGIIIGADSDASGTDGVQIQTRGITRLAIENDGDYIFGRIGTDEVRLAFATTHATAAYGLNTSHADFSGVRDHVMNLGFNIGPVTDSSKESLYVSFESRFKTGSLELGEVNWEARHPSLPTSVVRRFQSFNIDWLTGEQGSQFNGSFSIADKLGTTGHVFIAGTSSADLQLTNGTGLILKTNNTAKISQRNAGNTDEQVLMFLDNGNIVQIAPNSTGAQIISPTLIGPGTPLGSRLEVFGDILLRDESFGLLSRNTADTANIVLVKLNASDEGDFMPGGQQARFGGHIAVTGISFLSGAVYMNFGGLVQVEVGAADSGGTGYRMMRVAN